jgi:hypothetical protein
MEFLHPKQTTKATEGAWLAKGHVLLHNASARKLHPSWFANSRQKPLCNFLTRITTATSEATLSRGLLGEICYLIHGLPLISWKCHPLANNPATNWALPISSFHNQ